LIQLVVGHPAVIEDQGKGTRRIIDLLLEQLRNRSKQQIVSAVAMSIAHHSSTFVVAGH
jgi:hypothetical protein